MIQIAPSILSANSAKIKEAARMAGPAIIDKRNPQDSIAWEKI